MGEKAFLDRLGPDDKAEVMRRIKRRTFGAGAVIVEQEDRSNELYIVLEGIARAELRSEKGRSVTYRDIGCGEIFGEIAAIDGGERSASVYATGTVIVGALSATDFWDLLCARRGFASAVLLHLTAQCRVMTGRIFEFTVLVMRERLIAELVRSATLLPGSTIVAEIRPGLTHQELANMISCHREAVSREMSKLRKLGLVSYSEGDGAIRIKDLSALNSLLADTDS